MNFIRKVIGQREGMRLVLRQSSGFGLLLEVHMPRWSSVHFIRQIQRLVWSMWARPTAVLLTLFFAMPVAALGQGSPFDTGFNAIQALFTGTIAKVGPATSRPFPSGSALRQEYRWRCNRQDYLRSR